MKSKKIASQPKCAYSRRVFILCCLMLAQKIFFLMCMKPHNKIIPNIMAGLTVSFVALSLGAAFGILSGRGAFAGMLSAALIAFVTSAFGGTRIQCSGPTGPMTAVTAVLVATAFDQSALLGTNADHFINLGILLGGVFMIVFGILRLGKYVTLIPNVVISGFMNGIAIIIWLDQIKRIFGLAGKTAIAGPLWQNIALMLAACGLVFGANFVIKKIFPRIAGLLSGTLVTLILLTVIAAIFFPLVERVALASSLKSFGDVATLLSTQFPTEWSPKIFFAVLPFALQLAILGYLDSLMTALVIDKMTKEKTRNNKELIAQGLSNSIVAFVGGIPGAQATIRSVLIVRENATMRLAGIMVGVFALVEMIVFQDIVSMIPQAVFAGILLKVGYDVFDWLPLRLYAKELRQMSTKLFNNFFSRHDDEKIFVTNRELLMILGTTAVTVFFDLNMAVGVFTAIFYLHNKVLFRQIPMRDLKSQIETEGFADER